MYQQFFLNSFSDNENIEYDIGRTNNIEPYSLLIDIFKEKTNHIKDYCYFEDIMEVREIFNRKII